MAGSCRRPGARPGPALSEAIYPSPIKGSRSSPVRVGPTEALSRANSKALQANSATGGRRSNLATVKLLGRRKGQDTDLDESAAASAAPGLAGAPGDASREAQRTGPKGRPTPKRNEARRNTRKGPVAPAPMTASEARARRKSLAGPKLSRDERRAAKAAGRAGMSDRRERMMAG